MSKGAAQTKTHAAEAARLERAKVSGKLMKQDRDAKRTTARQIHHRPQSRSDGEDDDGLAPEAPRQMLSEAQVLAIIPMSRVTLWRMEKAGSFPKSTYVSPNRRFWFADEIAQWQLSVNQRDPHRNRGRSKGQRRAARQSAEA